MARSPLFVEQQQGGMFSIVGLPESPGSTFFVNSSSGINGDGYGKNPDSPFATIDYAVGKCTANKGDNIYVMPGHSETIISATGLVADIAGISIIGIGTGALQPTITLGTATSATISVTAANVKIKNIKVISDLADVAAGITVGADADGLVVEDCWITDGGLTKELVIGIQLATTIDNVLIKNNRFQTTISAETGGCASAIKFVGSHTNCKIVHNFIQGHFTVAAIDNATASGIGVYIEDNHILQIDTDAGLGINLHALTSGIVVRNLVTNLKDTVAGIVAAGCAVAENYGSNALGASGILKPTADS